MDGEIIGAEREVRVTLRVRGFGPVKLPHSGRIVDPMWVRILYAGSGYVRAEVSGHLLRRGRVTGTEATGHWWHYEDRDPQRGGEADTANAPEWIRELCQRYAPPDFTAVS